MVHPKKRNESQRTRGGRIERRQRPDQGAGRRTEPSPAEPAGLGQRGERLQKVLAAAGLASRRHCEELIAAGRVEVDGQVVTQLGVRVDPRRQTVKVDGEAIRRRRQVYLLVHKPVGVVSTNRDPGRRPRVVDLVPGEEHLFSVGRLDKSSSGLILVTNDGALAHRMAHPRFAMPKTYRVTVVGEVDPEAIRKLRTGIQLAEGKATVSQLRIRGRRGKATELEMVLTEGRNREIRRVLAAVGHKVVRLQRVAIGPLSLGDLPPGAHRPLTWQELDKLRSWLDDGPRRRPARRRQPTQSRRRRRGRPGGPPNARPGHRTGRPQRRSEGRVIGAD